jgi:hypothetical protein
LACSSTAKGIHHGGKNDIPPYLQLKSTGRMACRTAPGTALVGRSRVHTRHVHITPGQVPSSGLRWAGLACRAFGTINRSMSSSEGSPIAHLGANQRDRALTHYDCEGIWLARPLSRDAGRPSRKSNDRLQPSRPKVRMCWRDKDYQANQW